MHTLTNHDRNAVYYDLTVVIADAAHGKYYRARVTQAWAERHNNGALVSLGLRVGMDGFTPRMLASLRGQGRLTEITEQTWNHSGCQSSCVLRGAAKCSW